MYCSIRNKLKGFNFDRCSNSPSAKSNEFYFSSCEYDIECTMVDNLLQKRITKTLEIKSYKDTSIEYYPLITSCFSPDDKVPYCKIESLHIDCKEYNIKKYVSERDVGIIDPLKERSGYNKRIEYCLTEELRLSSERPVKLSICYTTRVNKNDIISTFRLSYPCKSFKFTFRTRGGIENRYNISVNAFGFCDDGTNTPNGHTASEVRVAFNDWIFPLDGVAVALKEK